jgi:hypothetical protein
MTRARDLSRIVSDYAFVTLTPDTANPSVADGRNFVTANTVPVTYTTFTGGYLGKEILVVFEDGNTTLDMSASGLRGNNQSNWTASSGDFMKASYNGTYWLCQVARK